MNLTEEYFSRLPASPSWGSLPNQAGKSFQRSMNPNLPQPRGYWAGRNGPWPST